MKIVHVTKAADTFQRISLFAVFGLAILFIQSQNVSAQWTTNGNNINNTNTGNVGIGTTSPGEKLVTIGNVLVGDINGHTQLYPGYDSQTPSIFEVGYGTVHQFGYSVFCAGVK